MNGLLRTATHNRRVGLKVLLNMREVGEYIGMGHSKIYGMIATGKFPGPIKIGKSSRWHVVDIDAWIAQQKQLVNVG